VLLWALARRLKQMEVCNHLLEIVLLSQALHRMVVVAAIIMIMQTQVEIDPQNPQDQVAAALEAITLLVMERLDKAIKAAHLTQITIVTLLAVVVGLVRRGRGHRATTKAALAVLVLHHPFLDHL